jgi:hypothetical protein
MGSKLAGRKNVSFEGEKLIIIDNELDELTRELASKPGLKE